MVCDAAGELSHRHARPRRGAGGRACARRSRTRAARSHLCRDRRIHLDLRGHLRHRQHEKLPVERLCHSIHPYRRKDGAYECRPARTLPWRRAAGGNLSGRADDRCCGACDEHRPCRAPPLQHDRAFGNAVCDAERPDLRQRRLPHGSGPCPGARRLGRIQATAQGIAEGEEAARDRHRMLPRSRRRHPG